MTRFAEIKIQEERVAAKFLGLSGEIIFFIQRLALSKKSPTFASPNREQQVTETQSGC
jgi:hypothetical protein